MSGGDINDVYMLSTTKGKVIVKINIASLFPEMFAAEAKGLKELKSSNTFRVPEILGFDTIDNTSFLLLEYINTGQPSGDFWTVFGEKLALLHQQSSPCFGLSIDNYIGSLPQFNARHHTAEQFYIQQRLHPQFELAATNGFLFSGLDQFYKCIEDEIPKEPASLIHGDLWSGNFIVGNGGIPCLIDPAVAFAPREMDISMMLLFGGFDSELFRVYDEVFPFSHNWRERLSIWQLYYLLVHLNIFGSSYYDSVKNVLNKYS